MEDLRMAAELKCLQHKLNDIKNHINARLEVSSGIAQAELNVILNIIQRYEIVPNGWKLQKPLVPESTVRAMMNNTEGMENE